MGDYCEISAAKASEMIQKASENIATLSAPGKTLSNKDINMIIRLQKVINANNTVSEKLTTEVTNLLENQIELIFKGTLEPNPELVSLIDFSIDLNK